MATLSEIKTAYDAAAAAGGGVLTLTAANCGVPALGVFLTNLPDGDLQLPSPSIDLTGQTLTVTADPLALAWPIGSSGNRELAVTTVTLTLTGAADPTAGLSVEGSVHLGGDDLAVLGDLDGGRVVLRLRERTDGTVASASLRHIADFVTDGRFGAEQLPAGSLFDSVPLTALHVAMGFAPGQGTDVSAASSLGASTWSLVDGVELTGIGVSLDATIAATGRAHSTVGGDVHADVRFLGLDLTVRLALRGADAWQLELLPGTTDALPAITALAGWIGDAALVRTVTDGLDRLGLSSAGVEAVVVAFSMATRQLRTVTVRTRFTLDGTDFVLAVVLPELQIHGGLAPGNTIHLRELAGTYFSGAEHLPVIDLTRLDLSANPGAGRYRLDGRISGDWTFDVGPLPFVFTEFACTVTKTTGVNGSVTGGIDGYFSLFDADFFATAEHPTKDGGWQFSCGTRGSHGLTVAGIHQHLVDTYKLADTTLPKAIEGLSLDQLRIFFETGTYSLQFTCEASLPVGEQRAVVVVDIALESDDGKVWRKRFGGRLTVGGLVFDLHLDLSPTADVFVATYFHTETARPIKVRELVAAVSDTVAADVPDSLSIDLRDVVLAVVPDGFLFGLDLGVGLSLSDLPLVGQQFPADRTVGVDSLRVLVAQRAFTATETAAFNALLPKQVPALPAAPAKGVAVTARLNLGTAEARELTLPVAAPVAPASPSPSPSPGSSPVPATADDTKWFDVQRTFGPVSVERIGFAYAEHQVRFLLDAALSLAGLTLSLEGLTFGSPIEQFAPTFDLHGIGVDYRNGPVEIGGALLRTTVTPAGGGAPYDEYDGAALIRTASLSLAALGGYVYLNGQPSMFIYAVLDKALGGPPFFSVTGLAAGFGYNRRLVVPAIDQVATFPLITAAADPQPITGAANPRDLLRGKVDGLRTWIPPTAGSVFLALGVRFTSFQMIDSFALLVASFGDRFELDVLGLSTLVAPRAVPGEPAVSPLAEIQLAVRASFVPDDGVLSVRAQLTAASFVFSRDCHITGGFAFIDWFGGPHSGDFVLTVGGYHPAFRVPEHYPTVPRLGLNWQVDGNLGIKADAYLALTPNALMAGGHLQVVWQSGNLRAVFSTGVDFLIAWKPYHYDAYASVDFNVSYTFEFFGTHTISVDIGADLHIWGPDFAGTAHINLSVISFDVAFGAQDRRDPAPIGWAAFRGSFLPAGDLAALTVGAGLLRKDGATVGDLGVIDPQRLVLRADTVIPSTAATIRGPLTVTSLYFAADGTPAPFVAADAKATPAQAATALHRDTGAVAVGPMRVAPPGTTGTHLVSRVTVSVTRDGQPMEHHFAFTPRLTNLPAGLWAQLTSQLLPDPAAPTLVRDLLGGFELRPRLDPILGADHASVEGGLELFQYHLPALPGGRYTLKITQDVRTDEPDTVADSRRVIPLQQFTATGQFTVSGTRASLSADELYAIYPPDGGAADYTADLPHVILNHSTLPWQENADPARDDLPWLALLVFEATDTPSPRVADGGTVIDVAADRLSVLLPSHAALPLLAHVRRDADGAERAVIIGNRLPAAGADHVVHLVSILGRYGPGGFDPAGAATVALPSLKSWRFTCTAAEPDLTARLHRLAAGSGALKAAAAVPYLGANGPRGTAAYTGPLVAAPRTDRPSLPARAAADLAGNVSFAAAWQLGRLLAVQSKPFAGALYRWKRQRAQLHKSGVDTPPPLPTAVPAWLDDLAALQGVPYNYLVPDAQLAPAESLRFFSVHDGWLAALLDGALSIGRVTPSDYERDRTLAADLRAGVKPWTAHLLAPADVAPVRSGFLLRSHAVAGWPDLVITADRAEPPLHTTLLSADTVLCLFAGEITFITVAQPPRTLHFALGVDAPAWQSGDRVVDVVKVARRRIGDTATANGASATFAKHMLAEPASVVIDRHQQ